MSLGVVPFSIAKILSVSLSKLKLLFRSFCTVMIDCHNCHSGAANEQLKENLGDLCGFISAVSHDFLIIAGDWNTDIQRPCSFTHICLLLIFFLIMSVSRIPVMADSLPGLTMFLSPLLSPLWSLLCIQSWMAETCQITILLLSH